MPPEPFIALTLARILRPWGRRGEVAAEVLTDYPNRLASIGEVWLANGGGARRPARVVRCRLHKGQAVFEFAGITSIDDAEKLRGCEVQVPLSSRVQLPEGRFYISELVGCEVWENGAPAALGKVREVRALNSEPGAPEAWVLAVDTSRGELLIPLAAEICTRVDVAARRIDVRLPDGLLEINQ